MFSFTGGGMMKLTSCLLPSGLRETALITTRDLLNKLSSSKLRLLACSTLQQALPLLQELVLVVPHATVSVRPFQTDACSQRLEGVDDSGQREAGVVSMIGLLVVEILRLPSKDGHCVPFSLHERTAFSVACILSTTPMRVAAIDAALGLLQSLFALVTLQVCLLFG